MKTKPAPQKKDAAPSPAPTAPALIEEAFRIIDLDKVAPSKDNYRQAYDEKALEELTASVRAKGVLQPILVRPLSGNGVYEVVAGHRRRLAALRAGRTQIPAIVRDLTDEDALEIQVIENSQREDPNLMEEARGFKRLLDMGKHTPETLAAKLDRSVDYVLSRVRLLRLPADAQKKIADGVISLGHALLLTRLRNDGDQKELLRRIEGQELSVSRAKDVIRNMSAKLSDALFDAAGCEACEFLSRNQTALFPELKKTDECMDRSCWFQKTRNHFKALIAERKKEGFKTLSDAKKVEELLAKGKKIVAKIQPPGSARTYDAETPARYKSECMKCHEHHCFYAFERAQERWQGGGKEIVAGELCLNRTCLNNRNKGVARSNDGSTADTVRASEHTLRQHAEACRDRFLRGQLPSKVGANRTLMLRLAIYHLLDKLDPTPDLRDIICTYVPAFGKYDSLRTWQRHQLYHISRAVEPGQLDDLLGDIIVAGIQVTNPLALLQMTPEAGIDMLTDFAPDETYLKTLKKDELLDLASEGHIEIKANENSKKVDILTALLEHDLRGQLPDRLVAAVEQPQLGTDDDGVEIKCWNCNKPAQEDPEFDYDEQCCSACTAKFNEEEGGEE